MSMTCEEFEAGWEEFGDLEDLPVSLEEHRCSCPACKELVEDLRQIQQQARQMLPVEQPSDQVWEDIHRQLRREGHIHEPARERGFFGRIPLFGGFRPLATGLSYAAVFFVALGAVYLSVLFRTSAPLPVASRQVAAPPVASVPAVSSEAPAAEATAALSDSAIRQAFEKIPSEKRAIYETNLNRVNSSIDQLNAFLEEHPEDLFARELRREAYEQKNHLSETLVRWEEF